MVELGGRDELMLWEDRWTVKKKQKVPLVLEDKWVGQDFQKLVPLL